MDDWRKIWEWSISIHRIGFAVQGRNWIRLELKFNVKPCIRSTYGRVLMKLQIFELFELAQNSLSLKFNKFHYRTLKSRLWYFMFRPKIFIFNFQYIRTSLNQKPLNSLNNFMLIRKKKQVRKDIKVKVRYFNNRFCLLNLKFSEKSFEGKRNLEVIFEKTENKKLR